MKRETNIIYRDITVVSLKDVTRTKRTVKEKEHISQDTFRQNKNKKVPHMIETNILSLLFLVGENGSWINHKQK